jgi:hypothetical protein
MTMANLSSRPCAARRPFSSPTSAVSLSPSPARRSRSWLAMGLGLALILPAAACSPKPAASAPPPAAGAGDSLYNDPQGGTGSSQADRAADVEAKADEANTHLAKVVATAIRVGAAIWLANDDRCPTTQDLVAIKFVNEKVQPIDPWGAPYVISCAGKEPVVSSKGPDGQANTADDIVVGK